MTTNGGSKGARASRRQWHNRLAAGAVVLVLAVGGTVVAATASTSSRTASQLQVDNASPYTGVLANSKGFSLYVLSVESKGALHCKGACLKVWPPYVVKSSVKSISKEKGVKGKVGFVKRTSTMKQVTFNGFPVYRYAGDTAARRSAGEGIVADGGTWTLTSAGATRTASTPIKQKAFLASVSASPYSNVLAQSAHDSLYVLSNESGGVLHCTGGCLAIWPPLLVGKSVTAVSVAPGVKGTIGFIARSSTTKQVTFNGFPVYRYSGDSGPAQSNGEGIMADGGTWDLASASATTAGATQIPPAPPGSTTTTTYYGY